MAIGFKFFEEEGITDSKLNDSHGYFLDVIGTLIYDGSLTVTNQDQLIFNPAWTASDTNAIVENLSTSEVVFAQTIDLFDDASIDTNLWSVSSGGSVTGETGGYIFVHGGGGGTTTEHVIGDGASNIDYKALSGDSEAVMILYAVNSAGGESRLEVSDGSTDVTLLTKADLGAATNKVINVIFDKSGEQCRAFVDGVEDGSSPFNLSALTNYYIKFEIYHDGVSNNDIRCYWIGYHDGSSTTGAVESAVTTLTNTADAVYCRLFDDQSEEASFTVSASADNKANYSTATQREVSAVTNSGTQAAIKLTYPLPTSMSKTVINLPKRTTELFAFYG